MKSSIMTLVSVRRLAAVAKISDNVLKNNRFFGITIQDGKYTSKEDKI